MLVHRPVLTGPAEPRERRAARTRGVAAAAAYVW